MYGSKRLGAVAIDYRAEDFLARVRELTDGEGVDVVLDSLGGPISLRSFRVAVHRKARRLRPLRHEGLREGCGAEPGVDRRRAVAQEPLDEGYAASARL